MEITEFLLDSLQIRKYYEKSCRTICDKFRLSITEVEILSFLSNNPGFDTAKDITELRMIPKANVSQAVDSLIKKELLSRCPDEQDRRRVHLKLLPASQMPLTEILEMNERFFQTLFRGFSKEELLTYLKLSKRICKNASPGIR